MKNDTEQALFWKKNFGDKYTSRAYRNSQVYTTRLKSWIEILKLSNDIKSVFEIGTNLGINLDAIKSLSNNQIKTHGIEINKKAYQICKKKNHSVINKDILNFRSKKKYDLSFSWGVLIHIHLIT